MKVGASEEARLWMVSGRLSLPTYTVLVEPKPVLGVAAAAAARVFAEDMIVRNADVGRAP